MVVLNEATVRTHCLSVWVGVGVGVEGGRVFVVHHLFSPFLPPHLSLSLPG